MGTLVRDAVAGQVHVVHPENPDINRCTHVRFVSPPTDPKASMRNAVIYGAEGVDRSPCGTGTSAEVAMRYAKGELSLGEEFVSESIIGSLFHARAVEETQVAGLPAIVPEVRGSAYITGIQQFVLDPDDPWPQGFYVGPKSEWS
jgi:proline racemase